jgi:ABC-type bacteriocin/lantibiotic exporter with double-glycine peptidase domain
LQKIKLKQIFDNCEYIFSLIRDFKKIPYLIYVIILTNIGAILELFSLAIIIPIINFLIEPTSLNILNFKIQIDISQKKLALFAGIFLLCFFSIKSFFLMYMTRQFSNFTFNIGFKIKEKYFEKLLKKDYAYHLKINKSHEYQLINSISHRLTNGFIYSMLIMFSEFIVLLFLFSYVVYLNFFVFLMIIFSFVILITLYHLAVSKINLKSGDNKLQLELYISNLIRESLYAIKELKIFNLEKKVIDISSKKFPDLAKTYSFENFIGALPRIVIEMYIISIFSMFFFLTSFGFLKFQETFSLLLIYGLISFRLIPAFTKLLACYNAITHNSPLVDKVKINFESLKSDNYDDYSRGSNQLKKYNQSIIFENICFSYQEGKTILNNICLNIPPNTFTVIMGKSGVGKTTFSNILLGLLSPTKGNIFYGNEKINKKNILSWKRKLSFVPQDVFIFNNSIKFNIALKENLNKKEIQRLNKIIKVTGLTEMISDLPNKENTIIEENGISISGGQKQRVGLARAAFSDSDIIILDESTSALDNDTENKILEYINNLKKIKTIIFITHKINILKYADLKINFYKNKYSIEKK